MLCKNPWLYSVEVLHGDTVGSDQAFTWRILDENHKLVEHGFAPTETFAWRWGQERMLDLQRKSDLSKTLKALLTRLKDVHPDDLPASLKTLRSDWIAAGCPITVDEEKTHAS